MNEKFSFGLIISRNPKLIDNYSLKYSLLLKLIEIEFHSNHSELGESDSDDAIHSDLSENENMIKFLFIKYLYLDLLKIYSCITWMLNDLTSNNILDFLKDEFKSYDNNYLRFNQMWQFTSLKSTVKKYLRKCNSLDVVFANKEVDFTVKNDKINFLKDYQNLPIVLNAVNSDRYLEQKYFSNKSYGDSNDFVLNITQCFIYSFIKKFKLDVVDKSFSTYYTIFENNLPADNLCDLPLLRSFKPKNLEFKWI